MIARSAASASWSTRSTTLRDLAEPPQFQHPGDVRRRLPADQPLPTDGGKSVIDCSQQRRGLTAISVMSMRLSHGHRRPGGGGRRRAHGAGTWSRAKSSPDQLQVEPFQQVPVRRRTSFRCVFTSARENVGVTGAHGHHGHAALPQSRNRGQPTSVRVCQGRRAAGKRSSFEAKPDSGSSPLIGHVFKVSSDPYRRQALCLPRASGPRRVGRHASRR